MKGGVVLAGALLLPACIPVSDPPPGYRAAGAPAGPWRYGRSAFGSAPAYPTSLAPTYGGIASTYADEPDAQPPSPSKGRFAGDDPAPAHVAPPATHGEGEGQRSRAAPERLARADAEPPRLPGHRRPTPEVVPARPAPPAWEGQPIELDASVVAEGSTVVRPGDTLGLIAERTGAGAAAIARANGLAPPFAVRAGQRLTIPAGRYHLVRSGQSGIGIARAYGVPWSRIVDANALPEPIVLRAGERILIPGTAGRPSAAERAAAFRLDVGDIVTGGEPASTINEAPARPIAMPARKLPTTAAIAAPARLRGGFDWPVDGRVLRGFGEARGGGREDGIEVAAGLRSPVRAAADGVVAYAGNAIKSLGGLVIVRHGGGWSSVYGHAGAILVARGQMVRRGETIALAGRSGDATRPEVHFELRHGRAAVDPVGELPER